MPTLLRAQAGKKQPDLKQTHSQALAWECRGGHLMRGHVGQVQLARPTILGDGYKFVKLRFMVEDLEGNVTPANLKILQFIDETIDRFQTIIDTAYTE